MELVRNNCQSCVSSGERRVLSASCRKQKAHY